MQGDGRGSKETLPSGKVRATFRAPDGSRQRMTFADEDDADLWLAGKRIEVKRGIWQAPKPAAPTLRDYAQRWIAQRRNRRGAPLKPRTVHEYRRYVERDLAPLTHLPIDQIKPADVRAWYVTLDDRPTAQANAYGLLRSILTTAIEDELIDRNPCRIRGGSSKDRASTTTVLSPLEVDDLAGHMPPWYRALVYVAAFDCLRFGECAALRRMDVAEDGSSVTVSLGATWTPGQVHIGAPKSAAGSRTVAMPPHVAGVLVAHLDLWVPPAADALVFTSSRGTMLRQSTLARSFYKARAAIGREDLRWHDLRHTGATMAAQAGATLAELQARLGHSTVGAAMRYQHATDERDRLLAARISELAASRLRVVN